MTDSWGTPKDQPPPEPIALCAEHAWLCLAIVSITASTLALAVEQFTAVTVFRGAYSVLAGLFVAGVVGWIVGSAERRVRRDFAATLAEVLAGRNKRDQAITDLTAQVAALREQVSQQRITYLPAPRRHGEGQRYIGSVAVDRGAEHDTIGLDPEALAAARRITHRLRAVNDE